MKSELKKEILSLLQSPELTEYLQKHTELLTDTQYAQIIAGAPIAIEHKAKLLHRMVQFGSADAEKYAEFLDGLLDNLAHIRPTTHTLLVYPMAYYATEKNVTAFDGPFPVRDLIEVQCAIQNYNKENMQDEEFPYYWKIEIYDFFDDYGRKEFPNPSIICICNSEGEIQYIKTKSYNKIASDFGSWVTDLNLPVPYQPGDILEVDCRPYIPKVAYCLITEVGDDCCGVQCVYPCANNKLNFGAFKHGNFFDDAYQMPLYMSPLYRSRIVHKPLPEFYAVLEKSVPFARDIQRYGELCRESGDFEFENIFADNKAP